MEVQVKELQHLQARVHEGLRRQHWRYQACLPLATTQKLIGLHGSERTPHENSRKDGSLYDYLYLHRLPTDRRSTHLIGRRAVCWRLLILEAGYFGMTSEAQRISVPPAVKRRVPGRRGSGQEVVQGIYMGHRRLRAPPFPIFPACTHSRTSS